MQDTGYGMWDMGCGIWDVLALRSSSVARSEAGGRQMESDPDMFEIRTRMTCGFNYASACLRPAFDSDSGDVTRAV